MAFIMSMIIILYLNSEQCSGQHNEKFRCETCAVGRSQGKYDCYGCNLQVHQSDFKWRRFACRNCRRRVIRDKTHECRRCEDKNPEPSQMTYNSCPACPIPNYCNEKTQFISWDCISNTWFI